MSASDHHNHNTVDVTGHITSHYCGDSFTLPPPLHPRIPGTQQDIKLNLCQKSTLFLLRVPSHLLLLTVLGLAGLGSSDWAVLHSSQNVCLATVLCCPQPSPTPLTQGSLASTTTRPGYVESVISHLWLHSQTTLAHYTIIVSHI